MTQQLGKHNASGPAARRRDGTIDPAGYVKSRVGDRRNLASHGVLLVGWGVIWGLRGGDSIAFVLAMIAAVVIVEFGALYGLRFLAERRELRRRAAGHPPGWPAALIAVLQARQAGFEIVADYRNDTVVRGRLTAEGDRWSWSAEPSRKHPVGVTITLDTSWAPAMSDRVGYRHIVTFNDRRAQRLDFFVGPRRDLRRYLSGVR
jgi:hypothetical protein